MKLSTERRLSAWLLGLPAPAKYLHAVNFGNATQTETKCYRNCKLACSFPNSWKRTCQQSCCLTVEVKLRERWQLHFAGWLVTSRPTTRNKPMLRSRDGPSAKSPIAASRIWRQRISCARASHADRIRALSGIRDQSLIQSRGRPQGHEMRLTPGAGSSLEDLRCPMRILKDIF
jgi:hypothetical protein